MTTIHQLIERLNASENAHFNDVPQAVINEMSTVNASIIDAEASRLASLDKAEFFAIFFSPVLPQGLQGKDAEKAVKNAVSITTYKVFVNDNALLDIMEVQTAIPFKKVFDAKVKSFEFAHTDKKPAEDKRNAYRFYFGDLGVGLCDLLTHSAFQFCDIGENELKVNQNYVKALHAVQELCDEQKKQNPFGKKSNNGYTEQLTMVYQYFMDNAVNVTAYHAKAIFQMVCPRNKYGKQSIANTLTMFDALAVVYRYAYNGYKLPITDNSNIYKQPKQN